MSVTAPSIDLIGILDAIPPYLLTEANRIPDAEDGTPEAAMTLAERQPRFNEALPRPTLRLLTASAQMSIDQSGLTLIEEFEGGRSSDGLFHAYYDSYGRVETIGFGETSGVHAGEVWTLAQAQADLVNRLRWSYEPSIWALDVPLNQHQFDALCSFVWNLGPGSMSSSWTIGRLLREKDYVGAANSMLDYDTAGGVVLAGLRSRREAERALFLTPMPPPPDPHHYARFPVLEKFNGKRWNEREYVERYDEYRAHRIRKRKALKISRGHMKTLAEHVRHAAIETGSKEHPDWGALYRGWRYQELMHRAEGKVVKV